ncbi:DUF4397 domain-containing protein [Spirosoma rhododendri]|uniref:DUF4397 domain-containing protein n=1 Tax=Spirosoma rhododendri TaxID=2728024 RepID=A0A7L5DKT2_9BACT|nr:DUF4397 domain-containing protein [Spirosoma rhododendri]QJD77008.1 DUF4397 domain-containing protein [Spirosoma rhododendri]
MRNYTYVLLLLATLIGWSCERETLSIPSTPTPAGARIKLVHTAPEAASIDLYINDQKISAGLPTGASSISAGTGTPTAITYGSTFPGSGVSYAVVQSGQVPITLSSPAATTTSSTTTVATQTLTLNEGSYYSLLVFGTGTQPQVKLIPDDFSAANDPSKFYVRFINLIPNAPAYDLALSTGTVLASNIAYQGISSFVGVDVSNNASFVFRLAGTTTNVTTAQTFTSSTSGRVVTIVAQGIFGRTGTAVPRLFIYVNR